MSCYKNLVFPCLKINIVSGTMLTPRSLNCENITTIMSRRFNNQNHGFLRSNAKRSDAVNKISVINVKSELTKNVTNLPKKEEKIPTVREILETYLENTSVHGLQYFGKTNIKVGILGKILWTSTIFICFVCTCDYYLKNIHIIMDASGFRFKLDGDTIFIPLQRESDQNVRKILQPANIRSAVSCCNHLSIHADSFEEKFGYFGELRVA